MIFVMYLRFYLETFFSQNSDYFLCTRSLVYFHNYRVTYNRDEPAPIQEAELDQTLSVSEPRYTLLVKERKLT